MGNYFSFFVKANTLFHHIKFIHLAEDDNRYTDVPRTIRPPHPEECILICCIKITATFAIWQHALYLNLFIF